MPTKTFFNLSPEKQKILIDASIEEFSERSITESKIALIMKRANFSRGSFYNYFDSIEDLYQYTIMSLRQQRLNYLEDNWDGSGKTFFEYFKGFYLKSVEFLLDNPDYIKLTRNLYASYHKICVELMEGLRQTYHEMYLKRIDQDKENGIIREDVNTEMLSSICVHYSTVIFVYEMHDKELTLDYYEKQIDELIEIISKGVLMQ